MRKLIFIPLAVLLVLIVPGCMYKVFTNGYSDPSISAQLSPESKICVVENPKAENPLLEKEIKAKVVTLLRKKGYQISSLDTADFYLIYFYGVGHGQTVTGVHTSTSYKLNIYTGQFEQVPQTYTSTRTERDRWLLIKVVDAKQYRGTESVHTVWIGETYSRGSNPDIREVINYLLIPTFEHFGEDTGKAVRHRIIKGNKQVKELEKLKSLPK
jgi:hypothetical protein